MTNRQSRPWRPQLTRAEMGRGWVFFALYVLLFPWIMGWVQRSFHGELPIAEANVVYYLLSGTLVFLVFWTFLKHGFHLLLDWLPENLFAFGTGLVGWAVLAFLAGLIPLPVQNPNLLSYPEQYALAPKATVIILVVLMPIVEEPLFRGRHQPQVQLDFGLRALHLRVRLLLRVAVRLRLWRGGFPLPAAGGGVSAHVPGSDLVLRQRRLHLEPHRPAHGHQYRYPGTCPVKARRLESWYFYAPYSTIRRPCGRPDRRR